MMKIKPVNTFFKLFCCWISFDDIKVRTYPKQRNCKEIAMRLISPFMLGYSHYDFSHYDFTPELDKTKTKKGSKKLSKQNQKPPPDTSAGITNRQLSQKPRPFQAWEHEQSQSQQPDLAEQGDHKAAKVYCINYLIFSINSCHYIKHNRRVDPAMLHKYIAAILLFFYINCHSI